MRIITKLAAVVAASALAVPGTACSAIADTVGHAPSRVLAGAATGLSFPTGITRGPGGEWYVANAGANSITVYARGATGNAAPVRTIVGASTGLSGPYDVAVDSGGFTYVTSNGSVRVFAPGASGNVPPVKVISGPATTLSTPVGIVVLPDGSVAVANYNANAVVRFAPTATGNAAPAAVLKGAATGLNRPIDLAFTPSGRLYTVNGTGAVNVFDHLVDGNVAPTRTIGGLASDITVARSLALDSAENVYVSTYVQNKLVVFPAGSNGNATPRRVLLGASSQLSVPWGLYVGGDRTVTVGNYTGKSVNTYAPLVSPAVVRAPSAVRALTVGGRPKAKKRTIRWAAPASNGGAPLTRYDLVVKKRGHVVRSVHLAPSHRSYVLKAKRLKKGRYTVLVRSVNSKGGSPYVAKAFRIRR